MGNTPGIDFLQDDQPAEEKVNENLLGERGIQLGDSPARPGLLSEHTVSQQRESCA